VVACENASITSRMSHAVALFTIWRHGMLAPRNIEDLRAGLSSLIRESQLPHEEASYRVDR
jgi:hypothetical protein